MSSTEESTELKAGHPPAEKIGGMRVGRPNVHHHSGDKEETKQEEEDQPTTVVEKPNPHENQVVSGALASEGKAFPEEAVKHYQQKPHTRPTNEKPHLNTPAHNVIHINQPR